MRLSQLTNGEKGVIVKVLGHGSFRKRILELGFVRGKTVEVIKEAPLKDPTEYKILDYQVTLRKSAADLIEVISPEEAKSYFEEHAYHGTKEEFSLNEIAKEKIKEINVAFVGNPNCGKSSLFNQITGEKAKVGNYTGVTVDVHTGSVNYKGYKINFIDLPGTYSLTAYSPDEVYVRRYLRDQNPDIVLNVISASNLERNLYLTTELVDMDLKLVGALNMFDELKKSGGKFDYKYFGKLCGMPIVPSVGSTGEGKEEVLEEIIKVYEDKEPTVRHIHIQYGKDTENAIKRIREALDDYAEIKNKVSTRALAVKLIENDKEAVNLVKEIANSNKVLEVVKNQIKKIEDLYKNDAASIISEAKYGFINGALKETLKQSNADKFQFTKQIDALLTHKFWGYPIFFLMLWFMFYTTFTLGAYPSDWIDAGVNALSNYLNVTMNQGPLKDLLITGIVQGCGAVLVFMPIIMILYLFISLLEDSGYMARGAFIMDKLMHSLGLHGKSFIPMIMGFGCNVPAIMASRTIENKNNRLVTILVNPLMSCSARLPVYILICGAFFPNQSALMLFVVYTYGILLAIILAKLFGKFMFKSENVPFVMELPPYRRPSLKQTAINMWHKSFLFLKKIFGIVLVSSIVIWFLSYYPKPTIEQDLASNLSTEQVIEKNAETQPSSYLERIGKGIEPVLKPLGLNWEIGVGLITGLIAKELMVSAITVISDTGEIESIAAFEGVTAISAFGLLIFTLIYSPCVTVIAAIRSETSSSKIALFAFLYTTILAWIMAYLINIIGHLFV